MKRDKPEGHLAGEAMRDAVRDQIKAADPPEAKRTFERLRASGLSKDQAIEFMAAVLAGEIFDILKNKRSYDREHYEIALRALPKLPWDSDEDSQ